MFTFSVIKETMRGDPELTLRWEEDIDAPEGTAYRRLFSELSQLHGVEHVDMRRYSAVLTYAPHVVDSSTLAEAIARAILDTGLKEEFKADFGFDEVRVA